MCEGGHLNAVGRVWMPEDNFWELAPLLWALLVSRRVCAASISALRATSRHPHPTHLVRCFETGSYTLPQDVKQSRPTPNLEWSSWLLKVHMQAIAPKFVSFLSVERKYSLHSL